MTPDLSKPERRGPKPRKRIQRGGPIARKTPPARSTRPIAKSDKKIPRRKTTPLAKLLDRLWDLFRRYVYERDGSVCISCGATGLEGRNRHAGHLFNAGNNAGIKFEPKNVHVQCFRCNIRLKGNGAPYALAVIDRYGLAEYKRLGAMRKAGHRWRVPQVRELIEALERSPADYECLYAEKYGLAGAIEPAALSKAEGLATKGEKAE